jgi:predicted nucleotidyltransferase
MSSSPTDRQRAQRWLSRTTLQVMRRFKTLSMQRAQIREVVLSHRVSGVRVFGSALRVADTCGSDSN